MLGGRKTLDTENNTLTTDLLEEEALDEH